MHMESRCLHLVGGYGLPGWSSYYSWDSCIHSSEILNP